jgi:hydroxymethylpyrimidine pyrophosphatase-like HAD family hydrolase
VPAALRPSVRSPSPSLLGNIEDLSCSRRLTISIVGERDVTPDLVGWRPKLVVLDLDGTVVGYDAERATPSERVRAAVAATLAAGVPVTIATGRAVWSALPTAAALGLTGIRLVCSNGAIVYDADTETVLHDAEFDPRPPAEALRKAALAGGDGEPGFAVERGLEGFITNAAFNQDFVSKFVDVLPVEGLVDRPTRRMVCRPAFSGGPGWGPTLDDPPYGSASAAAKALADNALDASAYSWEIGYTGWIDIIARGVSKATGAGMLAADLGIDPADVLAIGDGSNDMPMFAWAGRPVAMAQAPATVRAAASATTASVDEDGVAVELERWFGTG